MKLPLHGAGACLAMALAACSGAQSGSFANAVPPVAASQIGHVRASASTVTTPLILVANEGAGTGGSILEFAENSSGNVAPTSVITNHNGGPFAIALSSTQQIGVANGNLNSAGEFGAETFALATGDFVSGVTCLNRGQTNAVAFDSKNQLFVSRTNASSSILVFASGAQNCAKPKLTIPDAGGLAIDSNNVLYVANSTTHTVDLFASGSTTMEAQIGGSNTGLQAPDRVALDASRNVYVFDTQTSTISEFAAGAHGNVAPIRTISGTKTGLSGSTGFNDSIAVSKNSGEIFAANPGPNEILVFAANATGNSAPVQTIAGVDTELSDPLGITVTE